MCGISGIYYFEQKNIERNAIRSMNDIIKYRGPDDEGYYLVNTRTNQSQEYLGEASDLKLIETLPKISEINNQVYNLGFGFRRLAIVDLSIAGHQPMIDDSGLYSLIFNGEIYNYLELKKELKVLGYQFRTIGDAEVLIKSYIQWGENCVERFIGMFSFVIWDKKNFKLFGARDRFGVKPLTYYIDQEKFIFGSEEKQIIASGLVHLEYNVDSFSEFFMHNQLHHTQNTFLKNIQQLSPGHSFVINNKKIIVRKYWEINPDYSLANLTASEKVDRFRALFFDAVKLRLRSDVPIGVALSGGLDSSSIAMASKSLLQKQVKTFSVYYDVDKKYDEREFIQTIVDTGGFDPEYYTQDEQINLESIQSWIFHQDGPTTGASPYSAFLNYKNVRDAGIIVLLNGQGGDETMAGYPYYFKYFIADQIRSFNFLTIINNFKQWSSDMSAKHALQHLAGGFLQIFLSKSKLSYLENRKYVSPEFYYFENTKENSENIFSEKFSSSLNQSLYDTLRSTMMPHLLHWEDRNSMACSIESRVPFLDHRLVEYLFALPSEDKIKNGTTKMILRNSLKDILPSKILNRRDKKGFGTPTDLWTSGLFREQIKELLDDSSTNLRPFWKAEKIRDAYKVNAFAENELWKIVSSELFMREFDSLYKNSRNDLN